MSDNTDEHAHPDYRKIYYRLLILLVVSIWGPIFAENIWGEGSGNENVTLFVTVVLLTAFGVGFVKAGMVAAWFMHLDIEAKVARCLLAVCIAFLLLFFGGVAPEVLSHEGRNREADPDPIYKYPKEDKKAPSH